MVIKLQDKSTQGEEKRAVAVNAKEEKGRAKAIREVKPQEPPFSAQAALPEQRTAFQANDARQTAQAIDIIHGLSPTLDKRGEKLRIVIMTGGGKEVRKILTDRSGVSIARAHVMSLYENNHNESLYEKNLRAAISRVTNDLFTRLETGEDDFEEDTPKLGVLIREVEESAEWIAQAIDAGAKYARVAEGERRGMWRLQGNKTARFCNVPIDVLRGRRPGVGSKTARLSSTVLRFACPGGDFIVEVTDDQFTSNELANKLLGLASYPETDIQRRQFAEMIKELGRTEGALYQDELETYGMIKRPDGTYFFALLNGCETAQGFLEGESAPALAPSLPVPTNGYTGKAVQPFSPPESLEDDFYHLLLNQYAPHPQVDALNCALIGLGALIQIPEDMLPPGLSAEKGYLRISPDVVGPSRHGKSRLLNAHLYRFGTGFKWSSTPLTMAPEAGKGDTSYARNNLIAAMKNMLYIDFDHKAAPGTADFPKHHDIRRGTILNYVDGAMGGARGKRSGGIESRPAPSGLCVRTCNYDHAITSIEEDMAMVEARACSFLWPEGVKGDEDVSRMMDEKDVREQGYAIDQGYRRWIMQYCETSPEDFKALLMDLREVAFRMVSDAIEYPERWPYDWHKNHVELMVMGCLVYMEYLNEVLSGYHLYGWIETHMDVMLQNRLARSLLIREMELGRAEDKQLDQVTIEAIKVLFSLGQVYIRSQRGELLAPADIDGEPFTLEQIGYRPRIDNESNEVFQPGQECIGYWINKGVNFAFEPTLFYHALEVYAKQHKIMLGGLTSVLRALYEKGMLIPRRDKQGNFKEYRAEVRIKGRRDTYVVMPVAAFFAAAQGESGEEINPEDESGESRGENVRDFPTQPSQGAYADSTRLTDVSDDAFEEIPLL